MTLTKTPIPFCSLKFIDEMPRMREVDDRLKETLRELRNRKLMAAGSVDHGNDPVLWHQLINDKDRTMTKVQAPTSRKRTEKMAYTLTGIDPLGHAIIATGASIKNPVLSCYDTISKPSSIRSMPIGAPTPRISTRISGYSIPRRTSMRPSRASSRMST